MSVPRGFSTVIVSVTDASKCELAPSRNRETIFFTTKLTRVNSPLPVPQPRQADTQQAMIAKWSSGAGRRVQAVPTELQVKRRYTHKEGGGAQVVHRRCALTPYVRGTSTCPGFATMLAMCISPAPCHRCVHLVPYQRDINSKTLPRCNYPRLPSRGP